MTKTEALSKLRNTAEKVAAGASLELVEVELKGSGRNQLVRVVIDKPEGVTHGDCELVSRAISDSLDADDPVEGSYQLEVSSPGVERELTRPVDWERFIDKKVKVVLKEPVDNLNHFEGTIAEAANGRVAVQLGDGHILSFTCDQVKRANLKFEW